MSVKTDQTISRRVRLSARLSVDITMGTAGVTCEWDPHLPNRLTKKEERRYYTARNACAVELARLVGGSILMGNLSKDNQSLNGMICISPDGSITKVTI